MKLKWVVVPAKKPVSPADLGRHAGQFARHVLPAAVKPIHSLWHEVLGFFFLVFAGLGIWKIVHNRATMGPLQIAIIAPLIVVLLFYGVSSFLKARKISRS
jgi:uncharacterized membrane protein